MCRLQPFSVVVLFKPRQTKLASRLSGVLCGAKQAQLFIRMDKYLKIAAWTKCPTDFWNGRGVFFHAFSAIFFPALVSSLGDLWRILILKSFPQTFSLNEGKKIHYNKEHSGMSFSLWNNFPVVCITAPMCRLQIDKVVLKQIEDNLKKNRLF